MKGRFWNITDLSTLYPTAGEILSGLSSQNNRATVLALHGELGAGKTTFVQTLARRLGVNEVVTSPTFVVMKNYSTADPIWKTLIHIDAYRLENVEELTVLGFEEMLTKPNTLVCIEWAEKVKELLPTETIQLHFELKGDERLITAT